MNKLILRFVLLFRSFYEKLGVDPQQLEAILLVKLTMDDRRPSSYTGRRNPNKETKNSSLMAMLLLFVMGLMMIVLLVTSGGSLVGEVFYLTMYMAMIAMTLVTDFTSVLIDVRDNYIILPRPVSDATFTVARVLHISIHISKLMISFSLPGLVYHVIVDGAIAVPAFIIEMFSATVFSIFLVNIIYLVVLKVTSPEKFKNFISYFQILFSVFIFAAYQLGPRLMRELDIKNIDIFSYPWTFVFPQLWFASFYDLLVHPQGFTLVKATLGVIGLIAPFLSVYVVVKFLAPGFNRKLSAISGSAEDTSAVSPLATPAKTAGTSTDLASRLSKVFAADIVEQAGFKITWWLTSRYRDFKVKVYPAFAYAPVYLVFFIMTTSRKGNLSERIEGYKNGSGYIFLLYLTAFVLITVLGQVTQSEKYKAAWVFFATPHNQPGKIVAGMYKAILCKFFFPFYAVVSLVGLYIWGLPVINDLLFAFFNIVLYGIVFTVMQVQYLPFSRPAVVESGKVFKNLFIMALIGVLGTIHYFAGRWEPLIWGLIPVSAFGTWWMFRYMERRDWVALEADYD